MATQKEIAEHLKMALREIGPVTPWFDKEVNEWIFSHPLYPVEYGGKTPEEVIENYPLYLREFIAHRLDNCLSESVEKKTKGWGGKREGSGRPKGLRGMATKTIRLRRDLAEWVKSNENKLVVLMHKKKALPRARIRQNRKRSSLN